MYGDCKRMKRKNLPIIFAAITVFFVSCGNTVSIGNANTNSKKALVSFSAFVNDASRAEKAEGSVINPSDVTEDDIKKVEFKLALVTTADDGTTTETPYKFNEGTSEETLVKTYSSIKEFEQAEFSLDIAAYTFYLDLFVQENVPVAENEPVIEDAAAQTKFIPVQSGKVTQTLKAGTNEITFSTKYVESGDISFSFLWDDADSRVSKVMIGLYSGTSDDALTAVKDFEPAQITPVKAEQKYTAVYNKSSVPNGSYQIGVTLYDKKDSVLNNFYYPLVVYGYKSFGQKDIENNYNKNYFITYQYNEGNVLTGKSVYFKEVFNQNTIVYLPDASCIERSGYDFKGWYTKENFAEDSLVKILDPAKMDELKDLTVYAKWFPKQDTSTSTTGTILFEDESIGYTITMTIDEPFTLNSGSASFDIVLSDGKDLVDDGLLVNPDEGAFPYLYTILVYGDKDINNFAKDDDNKFYDFMPSIAKETAEIQEGESHYTKPKLFLNPDVPLEVSGMYRVQVLLATSPQNLIYEFFDIPVENTISYQEDVTESGGDISENLKNVLKNRQNAEITVKLTGAAKEDESRDYEVIPGTLSQLASALWDVGILDNNIINLDLSELTDVETIPGGVFYSDSKGRPKEFSSIILPESLTAINEYAFKNCQTLSSVTIPASVTTISPKAFYGCSNLTNIEISPDNNNFEVRKNENAEGTDLILVEKASDSNYGDTIIWQYFPADAENVVLNYSAELYTGIKAIGDYVYQNITSIKEIESFGDIKVIGIGAYKSASGLSKINLNGVKIIDEEAFWDLANGCEINSTECSLQGINKKVFSNIHSWDGSNSDNYVYNISFSDTAYYYVLDPAALEDGDNWNWKEYVKGVLAGTDYSAVFNAAEPPTWSLKLEEVKADLESVDYNDPRHSRYGWGPSDGDEDPPLEEEVLVRSNAEKYRDEYFNQATYQLIVPLVRNDPNDPNND